MTDTTTKSPALQSQAETAVQLLDDWFDPIEAGLRDRVREFIQTMIETELEAALCRPRYARRRITPDESGDGPSARSHRFQRSRRVSRRPSLSHPVDEPHVTEAKMRHVARPG
jgi:hypothetical protein